MTTGKVRRAGFAEGAFRRPDEKSPSRFAHSPRKREKASVLRAIHQLVLPNPTRRLGGGRTLHFRIAKKPMAQFFARSTSLFFAIPPAALAAGGLYISGLRRSRWLSSSRDPPACSSQSHPPPGGGRTLHFRIAKKPMAQFFARSTSLFFAIPPAALAAGGLYISGLRRSRWLSSSRDPPACSSQSRASSPGACRRLLRSGVRRRGGGWP